MPAKKKVGTAARLLTFRVEPGLLSALDEYAKNLTQSNPGMRYSRTDAARIVLGAWALRCAQERVALSK